jgi:hypothetical protein
MTIAELLADAFERIREVTHEAVDGLTADQLAFRPSGPANSVSWRVWHLSRVTDDPVADAAGTEQVWTSAGWADRFALPLEPSETGYGHDSGQVAAVRIGSAELLTAYYDAVHQRTLSYVRELTDPDLDRIVDKRWDPPVSLGVRLMSVIADGLQHAGQAAYLRGIIEGG